MAHPHLVQFYEDELFLLDSVAAFLREGIRAGEPIIVVATGEHRQAIAQRLRSDGLDLEASRKTDRLFLLDAEEMLSTFMVDGVLDAARFTETASAILQQAAIGGGRIRAFGEMVDLLWQRGATEAAIELELLWNQLAQRHTLTLLCAYRMGNFHASKHTDGFDRVCEAHTHVIPTEAYAASDADSGQRLRAVSILQQRARALEGEIAERVVLERALRQSLAARREAEAAVQHSHDQLEVVLHAVHEGILAVDAEGRVVHANAAARALWGEHAQGRSLDEVLCGAELLRENGEPYEHDEVPLRVALRGREVRDALVCVRRGGSEKWLLVTATPIGREEGRARLAIEVGRDVSEQVRRDARERLFSRAAALLAESLDAENALHRLAELLVPAFADACLVRLDGEPASSVTRHGDPSSIISGGATPPQSPLVGIATARSAALRSPLAIGTLEDACARTIRSGGALHEDGYVCVPLRSQDKPHGALLLAGKRRYDAADVRALQELADRVSLTLANSWLYREAKDAANERELLLEREQRANRTKDEFLAMLGHELRNPLAPILTAVELMRLRLGDAASRERAVIERQVKHLVRLVDDLLDVSRITRGKIELRKQPIELSEVTARAIERASPLLEEKRHRLTTSIASRGLWVDGDAHRLAQVLANILMNAAKYTEPGGLIDVRTQVELEEAVVCVRDTGIGIPPDLAPRLFDLFAQGERSIDRSQGGLGLGLAIARTIVVMHGGTVSAHSDGPGRGSEFMVRLPLIAPPSSWFAADAPLRRSASSRRVLVIDDNMDAAESLAAALKARGHITHVAFDGPSGLARAAQFAPEVALVDIGLPVMDGYELAQRLRGLPGLSHIRIVAITGYGQSSDRERSLRAGLAGHLVKPVDLDELESVFQRLFTVPSAS